MSTNLSRERFAHLVDELLMLVSESRQFHSQQVVQQVLQESQDYLVRLRRRLTLMQNRYVVALVGLSNVGKSTLLNAILRQDLAPRRNGPCTPVPIEFAFGNSPQLTVRFARTMRKQAWCFDDLASVRELLEEITDENGANGSTLSRVEIRLPHALLRRGAVLADTPGFGAAQLGEAAGSHEESLRSYLQRDVAQVVWVVLAEQGIGKREKEFYEAHLQSRCDDIVVNCAEPWDEAEQERFRRRFAKTLGTLLIPFHFVVAISQDAPTARESILGSGIGIDRLRSRFKTLADPDTRIAALKDDLSLMAKDLGDWIREFRDERGLPLRPVWKPTSWARWIAAGGGSWKSILDRSLQGH